MLSGSIANAKLSNSTISGKALGANLDALTISTGLSGTSYNGSSAVTIAIDTATTVDKTTAQTLTNKSLSDSTTYFIDEADATKRMQFQLSSIATATTRTLTVPNVSGTIVTTGDTGSVTNAMLAGSIANAKLVNSSVTINGQAVSLGGQLTVSAAAPNNLTIGTGLTGTSIDQEGVTFTNTAYSGAAAVTITVDSTVTTNSGTQTLTNKSLSDSTTSFIDEADATKKMQFQLSSISTGTTRTLTVPNVNGTIVTTGDSATVSNTMLAGSIANDKLAGSIANSKLVNSSIVIGSTTVNLGDTITALAGITTIGTSGNVTVGGTLTVNGTTTTINSTTITVDDKNIELGSVATPTDDTANGGGITLLGATNKTIIWDSANSNWTGSEHWNIASGKTFKINNTTVLSSTQVLGKTIGGTSAGDIVDLDTTQTLTNKTLSTGCTFPTLNQNTSGSAGSAGKATNLVGGNNTTLLGSIPYQSAADTTTLLSPNTTTTKKFLRMTGNGTNGVAPAWDTVTATDVGLGNVTNESKATIFSSPTFTGTVSGVTATHVGLGSVTNESKATMFASPTFTGTVAGVTATHVGLGSVTNESKATMFSSPTFTGTVTTTAITTGGSTTAGTITGNWALTGKFLATYADLAEYY
jgi:macrodomain Ter protein organizer (MatP/YcbG family)